MPLVSVSTLLIGTESYTAVPYISTEIHRILRLSWKSEFFRGILPSYLETVVTMKFELGWSVTIVDPPVGHTYRNVSDCCE